LGRESTKAEREIAYNRRKIITAYEQSGLNPQQFVECYQCDSFLPEVKAQLGRWAYLKDRRRFYDTWLCVLISSLVLLALSTI
jgi:hypothetical protein